MQVNVAVGHAHVPAEHDGIQPATTVGELHAFGSRGGSRRVVDGYGRILVADRVARLSLRAAEEDWVGAPAEHEAVLDLQRPERLFQLGIDQQHGGPRVLEDVRDLVCAQTVVDRDEHAPIGADAEEAYQKAGGVGRHDGHPGARLDSKVVERGGQTAGHAGKRGIGDAAETAPGGIRLVHDGLAISVRQLGALEEIDEGQRNDHARPPCDALRTAVPIACSNAAGVSGLIEQSGPTRNHRPFISRLVTTMLRALRPGRGIPRNRATIPRVTPESGARARERTRGKRTPALPARVRPFLDPTFYRHRPSSVELIETHISWVFLAGEYVYKVKKPVSLGFLDFRTLARRRHFCQEEVRLNQRLAPNAYLDVVTVTGGRGRLSARGRRPNRRGRGMDAPIAGGRMLDHLVKAAGVDHRLLEDIGRTIAEFHATAACSSAIARFGRPEVIRRNMEENLAQTGRFPPEVLPPAARLTARIFLRQTLRGQRRRFAERVRAGRIRDCHGDLQAQHVCCTDPIQVFDCIEFNHRFRYGDTAGEIAFLAMDLDASGRPDLAIDFVNAYLDASGDFGAVPLLDFYRTYRAWIRGKVYGLQALDPARTDHAALVARARGYFDLAASYARPRGTPSLTVMTGLSASGKSTAARGIAHAASAIVVRTDAVRKQLAGVPWHRRHTGAVGEGLYTAAMTERTYATCLGIAEDLLEAGWSVVLDGVFGRRVERDAARALASKKGGPFRIVWCQAPETVLRERLRARQAGGRDLSDAREDVLDLQLRHYEPPTAEPDVERRSAET